MHLIFFSSCFQKTRKKHSIISFNLNMGAFHTVSLFSIHSLHPPLYLSMLLLSLSSLKSPLFRSGKLPKLIVGTLASNHPPPPFSILLSQSIYHHKLRHNKTRIFLGQIIYLTVFYVIYSGNTKFFAENQNSFALKVPCFRIPFQ